MTLLFMVKGKNFVHYSPVRYVFKKEKNIQLACVIRLARVHPEPGSNSCLKNLKS